MNAALKKTLALRAIQNAAIAKKAAEAAAWFASDEYKAQVDADKAAAIARKAFYENAVMDAVVGGALFNDAILIATRATLNNDLGL